MMVVFVMMLVVMVNNNELKNKLASYQEKEENLKEQIDYELQRAGEIQEFEKYTKTKKFKMPLYKESGITLININAKYDIRNLKTNLKFKLENHKTGISNFENE